jgi:hypothetical protein
MYAPKSYSHQLNNGFDRVSVPVPQPSTDLEPNMDYSAPSVDLSSGWTQFAWVELGMPGGIGPSATGIFVALNNLFDTPFFLPSCTITLLHAVSMEPDRLCERDHRSTP